MNINEKYDQQKISPFPVSWSPQGLSLNTSSPLARVVSVAVLNRLQLETVKVSIVNINTKTALVEVNRFVDCKASI